ncbi:MULTISPECIES: hypothetical protein [unclassified Rhizobium]|uniref:hypothetical protein n=1 Tax=unclassified Rhizobium TaxID=2613769 RepID=UPI001612A996|nr:MULTISPECIES: hypothetical protein [unclassified Rhizobium]MBB3398694.1 hypothetical protein [Rhizobium sp. BK060]MBB4170554.1 hypothetical protein [Rhizobium sp. BK538]
MIDGVVITPSSGTPVDGSGTESRQGDVKILSKVLSKPGWGDGIKADDPHN